MGWPTPPLGVGPGQAAPWGGLAALWRLLDPPLHFVFVSVKYGLRLLFRPIQRIFFCTTFLKYKTTENRKLTLWHLVNRLVPKMDKSATKCKQNIYKLV